MRVAGTCPHGWCRLADLWVSVEGCLCPAPNWSIANIMLQSHCVQNHGGSPIICTCSMGRHFRSELGFLG